MELGHVELLYAKQCMLVSDEYSLHIVKRLQDTIVYVQDAIKCLELEPLECNEYIALKYKANSELVEGIKLLDKFSGQQNEKQKSITKNNIKEMQSIPCSKLS